MTENCKEILTEEQMYLEIQLIINRQLYDDNIIDRATYEMAANYILKEIQKITKQKFTS